MSSELEKLRLFAAEYEYITGEKAVPILRKIARLEAEAADPWREAKEAIDLHLASGGHRVKEVARYARHLEDQNAAMKEALDEWDKAAWKIIPGHDSPPLPSHILRRYEELRQHAIELESREVPPLDPDRVTATAFIANFGKRSPWTDAEPYPMAESDGKP